MPPVGIGYFSFVYWVFSLINVLYFPYLTNCLKIEYCLLILAGVCVILMVIINFMMYDTTNKSKEEIE